MINYYFFMLKYYTYIFFSSLLKPKRKEFLVFFLGRYPENFRDSFDLVLDPNSLFRYTMSSFYILVRFDTLKNLDEIDEIFKKEYNGYADSYIIFDTKTNWVKNLDKIHYEHLYKDIKVPSANKSLEYIEDFILTLKQLRLNLSKLMENGNSEFIYNEQLNNDKVMDDTISINDIDLILDKIKEQGLESLTEKEKLTLKKYTNYDN